MDELNLKTLEQIPIPEGLEERLSAKIDEWEAKPTTPSIPPRGEASNTPPRGRLPLPASPLSLVWDITTCNVKNSPPLERGRGWALLSRTLTKTL